MYVERNTKLNLCEWTLFKNGLLSQALFSLFLTRTSNDLSSYRVSHEPCPISGFSSHEPILLGKGYIGHLYVGKNKENQERTYNTKMLCNFFTK